MPLVGAKSANPPTRQGRWKSSSLLVMVLLCALPGCGAFRHNTTTGLPQRHKFTADQLVVQSDIRLPKNHPLIQDLEHLREEMAHTLQLPLQKQPVTVYLFADEVRYAQYLQTAFPNLPPRRAYFVGTTDELAVYTFWGEKIQEDLRHEYTHGVLHASLKDVPLWLDEGLAEYFEIVSSKHGFNAEYAQQLTEALNNGWRPDVKRLEQLGDVGQMQKADYLEAWAWAHFMLHDSETTQAVLVDFLNELRFDAHPGPLSDRLAKALPHYDERFVAYAATLQQNLMTAGATRIRD